jgi:hypothetical protein
MSGIGRTLAACWGICLATWAMWLVGIVWDSPIISLAFAIGVVLTGLAMVVLLGQIAWQWWRRNHLA